MDAKVASAYFVVLLVLFGAVLPNVEAKSCCPSTTARNCYNVCRLPGTARETCAKLCGCTIISGSTCPSNYPKLYCTLGCESSQCSTIATPTNSGRAVDGGEAEAVRCKKACSDLCSDGYSNQVPFDA